MKKNSHWLDYEDRLSRVTAYISDHLDDPLDLQRLADIACLSPYHWHRIYHAVHGETIAATIKRLRLHRAAAGLADTSTTVAGIARQSGFRSLQSFTRAFKDAYGMPPARYRRDGNHSVFREHYRTKRSGAYAVKIRDIPRTTVVGVEHRGSYVLIGRAFEVLYGWLGARGLPGVGARSLGLYYDDPEQRTCGCTGRGSCSQGGRSLTARLSKNILIIRAIRPRLT